MTKGCNGFAPFLSIGCGLRGIAVEVHQDLRAIDLGWILPDATVRRIDAPAGRCVEDPPVIRADDGRAVEEALDQRVVLVGTRSLKGVDVAIRIS